MIDAKKVLQEVANGGSLSDYVMGVCYSEYGYGEASQCFGNGWRIEPYDKPDTWYLWVIVEFGQEKWRDNPDFSGDDAETGDRVYFYELI